MCKRMVCMLLSLLFAAGSLVGCTPLSAQKRTATYMDVFDTVTVITAYGVSEEQFAADTKVLHALLTEYHQLYDIYSAYAGINNLKTVNDAGGEPIKVDSRIVDLLEYGVEAYAKTDGRVNILFGSVLSLWHDSRTAGLAAPDKAALPDAEALAQAAQHTAVSALEINSAAGTVRLTDKAARIDVGALAKGYVTERVAQYAEKTLGWRSALLNIGGNVRAIGGKGGVNSDSPFAIGVQNPDTASAKAYLTTLQVRDMAVVTSGDYQRYYTVDGKRYAHIIDPETLYPAAYMRAVTVICPDSGMADMLSTALFNLPLDKGRALLEKAPDAEAVWVLCDGSVQYSAGFNKYQ